MKKAHLFTTIAFVSAFWISGCNTTITDKPAEINSSNAPAMALTAAGAIGSISDGMLPNVTGNGSDLYAIDKLPEGDINDTQSCSNGGRVLLSGSNKNTVQAKFDNCSENGFHFDGTIRYTITHNRISRITLPEFTIRSTLGGSFYYADSVFDYTFEPRVETVWNDKNQEQNITVMAVHTAYYHGKLFRMRVPAAASLGDVKGGTYQVENFAIKLRYDETQKQFSRSGRVATPCSGGYLDVNATDPVTFIEPEEDDQKGEGNYTHCPQSGNIRITGADHTAEIHVNTNHSIDIRLDGTPIRHYKDCDAASLTDNEPCGWGFYF